MTAFEWDLILSCPGSGQRSLTAPALRLLVLSALVAIVTAATGFGLIALPASAQTTVTTIEDTAVGTGVNQVSYSGTWSVCTGCGPATPNGSFRYSYAGGATVTIRFGGGITGGGGVTGSTRTSARSNPT